MIYDLPPEAYLNQPTFIEYRIMVPMSGSGQTKMVYPKVPNPLYYIPK